MMWFANRRTGRLSRTAQSMAAAGDVPGAIERLRDAVALDPENPFLHVHLALALAQGGAFDEAQDEARRAADLARRKPSVQLLAGRVHYEAGDLVSARRAFDAVLEDDPENDLAYGYRVLVDWASGDREAWQRLSVEDLPDSNPFLVRWLELVEADLLESPGPATRPLRGTPAFVPGRRRRTAFRPAAEGGRP